MELNNTEVTFIHDSQISSAGMLLVEAFFADPLNQYVFPDPGERRRVLSWYFAASVREGALLNAVYSTVEPIIGKRSLLSFRLMKTKSHYFTFSTSFYLFKRREGESSVGTRQSDAPRVGQSHISPFWRTYLSNDTSAVERIV